MAVLRVASAGIQRLIPLPTLCLVGRGPACLVRVDDPACPAHWLELRWRGSGWAWRALGAEERTRARGPFLGDGWRAMAAGTDSSTRIALGEYLWIELVDAGPPEPFAWDVIADQPLVGEALEQVAERRGASLLPIGAEGNPDLALRDGEYWMDVGSSGARTLRAHLPVRFAPTAATEMDLGRAGVEVEIDWSKNIAVLMQSGSRVEIVGTCIRTLVVYAHARMEGTGWLTATEAWTAWTRLGGSLDAPVDTVAWERARIRRLLDRAGVGSVDRMFSVRKEGGYTRVRLSDAVTDVHEVG